MAAFAPIAAPPSCLRSECCPLEKPCQLFGGVQDFQRVCSCEVHLSASELPVSDTGFPLLTLLRTLPFLEATATCIFCP